MAALAVNASLSDIMDALGVLRPGGSIALTRSADGTIEVTLPPGVTLPADAEIMAAITAAPTRKQAQGQARHTQYDAVRSAIDSAVGVPIRQLTAEQRQALLVGLLWRLGVVDETTGVVRPASDWLPPPA